MSNGDNSGQFPGYIRDETGDVYQMATEPLRWPNNMAEARDEAAEHIGEAKRLLNLIITGRMTDERLTALQIALHLSEALRWLELAGAPTRPEHL